MPKASLFHLLGEVTGRGSTSVSSGKSAARPFQMGNLDWYPIWCLNQSNVVMTRAVLQGLEPSDY